MRGYPGLNYAAFHDAAARLRAAGHEVFSPAEANRGEGIGPDDEAKAGAQIRRLLGADLARITDRADAVALLPGWSQSLGAQAGRFTALAIGIPVYTVEELLGDLADGGTVG